MYLFIFKHKAMDKFPKITVVLSGTRFLLFWRKKVLSNWFWHFFTDFSIFHEFFTIRRHFCGARHGFVAYAALQLKSVRSPQKWQRMVKIREK